MAKTSKIKRKATKKAEAAQSSGFSPALEKRDVWVDGKCKTIRIAPSVWKRFLKLCEAADLSTAAIAKKAQRECNGELAEAIEEYVRKHDTQPLYYLETRECWLIAAIDALRPIFAERGYPLPEKIRASVGFTSKGHRGKRVGECWSTGASADGTVEIFLDPSKIADALGLADVLTHELCHAWQAGQGKKLGHGADFKRCGTALNLEGKAAEMRGGKEWRDWAAPIVESLGPCPYAKMAEFMAKVKEKKQTTRMLKFEHAECPGMEDGDSHIWRSSGKGIAMRETVCCPCCGTPIPNPNFGDDEPDEVPEDQQ